MNRSTYAYGAPSANADVPYQRSDLLRREIVDHAVQVQQSTNTVSAIELLKAHDFDAQLIERVLLEPARRRAADIS